MILSTVANSREILRENVSFQLLSLRQHAEILYHSHVFVAADVAMVADIALTVAEFRKLAIDATAALVKGS